MNEKTGVTDKIIAYCKESPGYFIRKIHCDSVQGAGLPDLWGCYRGMFICCESKTGIGRTSRLQEHMLDLVRKSGGCAFVAHNLAEFIRNVEEGFRQYSDRNQPRTEIEVREVG